MKTLLVLVVVLVVIAAVLAAMKKKGSTENDTKEKPKRKSLMTEREQAMHNRLTQSLPDCVVLAQVSFSALLTARAYGTRNTFDRKTADFVVCDKAFQVLAVIELDDASHKGRTEKDAARDSLLKEAGYVVIRYANIPDVDRVRGDLKPKVVPSP